MVVFAIRPINLTKVLACSKICIHFSLGINDLSDVQIGQLSDSNNTFAAAAPHGQGLIVHPLIENASLCGLENEVTECCIGLILSPLSVSIEMKTPERNKRDDARTLQTPLFLSLRLHFIIIFSEASEKTINNIVFVLHRIIKALETCGLLIVQLASITRRSLIYLILCIANNML